MKSYQFSTNLPLPDMVWRQTPPMEDVADMIFVQKKLRNRYFGSKKFTQRKRVNRDISQFAAKVRKSFKMA